MSKAKQQRYSDEVALIDSFFAFHADWFDLPPEQAKMLDDYYGHVTLPSDLNAWRNAHVAATPDLAEQASRYLRSVLRANGVDVEQSL